MLFCDDFFNVVTWEQRKLNTYLSVSKAKNREGKYTKQDVLSVSGDFGIVNQIKFQGRSFAGKSVKNYKVVRTGDIVYTKSPLKAAPYGIIKANSGVPGIVSTLYAVYNPKENADSKFVELFFNDQLRLNKYLKPIVNIGAKHDMKVKNDEVINHPVVFPNKKEQLRISQLIKKLDDVIFLQQRKLDELTNLKKVYLYRLFPDEKQNIPILRFSNITNEWKKYKLGEISKRITRKNLDLESRLPLTISAQYGLIKQKDFFNKQVASKNLRNYILLKSGEFAYNKSYSRDSPYGAIKRLNSYPQGVISSLYIAFKPVDVDSNFLEQYYNSQRWYKEIYKVATEGARNHGLLNISPQDFFNTNLYIPVTKSEQLKIGALLNTLDRLITYQQKRITSYQRIKKFLLQNMFI